MSPPMMPTSWRAHGSHSRIAAAALLATLAALVALGFSRGVRDRVDWSYWRMSAEAVQRDGLPPLWSETYGYPPHVPLLWIPLTVWLPRAVGVGIYVIACAAMAWWIVRTVGTTWCGSAESVRSSPVPPATSPPRSPPHWTISQLAPAGLVLVHAANSFHQNQLSIPVLFGVVFGLTLIRGGKSWLGGAILGATISIKLVPLPILGILLIKRCWRAVAGAVLGGAAFLLLPCLLYYGPQRTQQALTEWLWRVRLIAPDSQIAHYPLLDADRSQALVSVLNRALRPRPSTNEVIVRFESAADALRKPASSDQVAGVPRLILHAPRPDIAHELRERRAPIVALQLASLSSVAVRTIHLVAIAGMIAATVWLCRRRLTATSAERFYAEMSLCLLVGVLLSPVVFAYYLVWAYPAWAFITRHAAARRWRWWGGGLLAAFWLLAQLGLLWPAARQSAVSLWATFALAIALAVVMSRSTPAATKTGAATGIR